MKDWNERVGSIRIANAYLRQRSFWTAAASSNQIIATIWIGDSMSVRWNGVAMSQMATWNSFPYPSTAACVSGSSFRVKSLKNKKKKKLMYKSKWKKWKSSESNELNAINFHQAIFTRPNWSRFPSKATSVSSSSPTNCSFNRCRVKLN